MSLSPKGLLFLLFLTVPCFVAALMLIPPAIPFLFMGGAFADAARSYTSFIAAMWFQLAVYQIGEPAESLALREVA